MALARLLVGGPLLGDRYGADGVTQTFEPIVTYEGSERYVLLPQARYVAVLALRTGRRIATLLAAKEASILIKSVAIGSFRETSAPCEPKAGRSEERSPKAVLVVGCDDGSVREFDLSLLHSSEGSNNKTFNCGDFHVSGPCIFPRRIFELDQSKDDTDATRSVRYLSVLVPPSALDMDLVLYAIVEESSVRKGQSIRVESSLLRLRLPPVESKVDGGLVIPLYQTRGGVVTIDKLLYYAGQYKKTADGTKAMPISILSASVDASFAVKATGISAVNVLIVVRPMQLTIYSDHLIATNGGPRPAAAVVIPAPPNKSFTIVCISPNRRDVACGLTTGEIRILSNLLPTVVEYCAALDRYQGPNRIEGYEKPLHPAKTLMARKLHWHAHPVAALAYDHVVSDDVDPMLHSGGEESVLVTWQLARGSTRPSDTLPRIALGGILHLCSITESSQPTAVLVYCADNSLHLFDSSSHATRWKLQGLALGRGKHVLDSRSVIRLDPRDDNQIIVGGFPNSSGYLYWYNIQEQCVKKRLEIAPYNRVSPTEPGESALPSPMIVCEGWSENGENLVTADTTATENAVIGASQTLANVVAIGLVTTLKFWSYKRGNASYQLSAAMTYPHGSTHVVSAVAMSHDGNNVCTVSNDDKAFRVWRKAPDGESSDRRSPMWTCDYKVASPSGYSNMTTNRYGVCFSNDGTVLAVCYNSWITLWNHQDSTLISSLRHSDQHDEVIESVVFLRAPRLFDLLLTFSKKCVTLQSPYGRHGPVNVGWKWIIPEAEKNVQICCATFVASHHCVSIAVFDKISSRSRLIFVDALSGELCRDLNSGADEYRGEIASVTATDIVETRNLWDAQDIEDDVSETSPQLHLLMKSGELFVVSNVASFLSLGTGIDPQPEPIVAAAIPSLQLLSADETENLKTRKRVLDVVDFRIGLKKALVLSGFGGADEASATIELPDLHGASARAFLSRNLMLENDST